jgi:hypothetical protein
MEIQIDFDAVRRNGKQNARLARIDAATKLLNASGYNAETVLVLISGPNDMPAYISVK